MQRQQIYRQTSRIGIYQTNHPDNPTIYSALTDKSPSNS